MSKRVIVGLSLLWFLLVVAWSFMTIKELKVSTGNSSFTITNLTAQLHGQMLGNFWHKDELIDINGGWAKILDQRMCNGALKLNNGYITRVVPRTNVNKAASRMNALASLCRKIGVECLFVMFPSKIDAEKSLLPVGGPSDFSNENADAFLRQLSGVELVDTRNIISATADDVTRYYFKTDHHWNFEGAFKASQTIAMKILSMLGENIGCGSLPQLDENNWDKEPLGRPFLGSVGRRTGCWFAGMDEGVSYLLPRFDTELSIKIPRRQIFRHGNFQDAWIFKENFAAPVSGQKDCGYGVYGLDYAEISVHNSLAPIKRRIFIIKDSYAIPVYAFLSTLFSEISIFDLRHLRVEIGSFIQMFKPDLVCVMYNPVALNPENSRKLFNFTGLRERNRRVKEMRQLRISAKPSLYNCAVLNGALKPGSSISCTVQKIDVTEGDARFATIALYERTRKKIIAAHYLEFGCGSPQMFCADVPNIDGCYQLLVFAGERGKTAGNAIVLHGVTMEYLSPE